MKPLALIKECKSWSDFQSFASVIGNKEKGDAFELLTKLYFKLNPVYAFYDEVWLLDEVPQKELDILNLPSQDLGIDLIAKSGNEYHAIQCKYHGDKNQNVTYREVSTFLQQIESNKRITLGYICSSANGMSKNYLKVQKKQVQELLIDTWQKLDVTFFDKARAFLLDKRIKDKPLAPYEHQEKAIRGAQDYFQAQGNSRGKLIFPCGSGKSLTGYWITEALGSHSTLIAVPSLSLVKQTLEVYLREIVANEIDVKWLCICSDEGIGKDSEVLVKTQDIGVPCLTDSDYISQWLDTNRNERTIIFTTYQSGRIIAEVSKKLKFKFDVGIFDEAHKTVGSKNKVFSHLLFEENIGIEKRIFMTATERFYSGKKEEIISMNDVAVYGDTFAYMSFKEAIEQELLTDYKLITIDIKKSEIADFIKENNLVQLNDKWKKDTEARSLASMLAMRKAMKRININHVVSFHSSIEKAKRYRDLQGHITDNYGYEPIDTYTVSGKIPTAKRNTIVQEFANSKRALITNARCLTEGIDVPNIDCIVFADPRKSKVDIVQALGRALRKKKGKEWGYVILPVVYDDETKEIDNDSYSEILSIVGSLASNDERIVEYFKAKSEKEKSSRDISVGSDLFSFDSSLLDENDFAQQLEIKIWGKLSQLSWLPFEEARTFVRSLKLKTQKEWTAYFTSDDRRKDIPTEPPRVYASEGWLNWGDWLGTHTIAAKDRIYLTFSEAKEIARRLNFKSKAQWDNYAKSKQLPLDIPNSPAGVYRGYGWKGWPDFLGNHDNQINRNWMSYDEASKYIQSQGITSIRELRKSSASGNFPFNFPSHPNRVYKNKGWIDFGAFFGTSRTQSQKIIYPTFTEAKRIAKNLNVKSVKDWMGYCRDHPTLVLPATADRIYVDEWKGWKDFLGVGHYSFEEARSALKKFKFQSVQEYQDARKQGKIDPNHFPSTPSSQYRDCGFIHYGDFFSNGKTAKSSINKTFEEAKEILKPHNLRYSREYHSLIRSGDLGADVSLPHSPHSTYKSSGFISWADYLGHSDITDPARKAELWYSFEEAKNYLKTTDLVKRDDWRKYCQEGRRPDFLPSNPDKAYANCGWKGFKDFLNSGDQNSE